MNETEAQKHSGLAELLEALQDGYTALEKRDWERAKERFLFVTDEDRDCAEAWFGLALAKAQCASVDEFSRARQRPGEERQRMLPAGSPEEERISEAVERFRVPGYFSEREIREMFGRGVPEYPSVTNSRRRRLAEERAFWETDPLISRAVASAGGDLAVTLRSVRERSEKALERSLAASERRDRERAEKALTDYRARMDAMERKVRDRHNAAMERREVDYATACAILERGGSPEELQRAAEAFEALGKFRDSRQRAQRCKEEAERIANRKLRRFRLQKLRMLALGVLAVVAVGAVVSLFLSRLVLPQLRYASAESMRVSGDYNGAAKAYAALGNYRDSAKKALDSAHEAIYQEAEALLAAGDAEGAAEKFRSLGDYGDSATRAEQIGQSLLQERYEQAEALLREGDYDRAAVGFRRLGEYADSALRAQEAQYRAAELLLQAGDYDGAILRFEMLADYGDSAKRMEEARELRDAAEEEGNP